MQVHSDTSKKSQSFDNPSTLRLKRLLVEIRKKIFFLRKTVNHKSNVSLPVYTKAVSLEYYKTSVPQGKNQPMMHLNPDKEALEVGF